MGYSSALGATLGGNYGGNGAVYTSDTNAVTGKFTAITAVAAAVFTSLTASDWTGNSTASIPLPAGMTIYGNFTGYTLASGKVIAYKAAFAPS